MSKKEHTVEDLLKAWGKVYAGSLTDHDPQKLIERLSGKRRAEMVIYLAERQMYEFVCSTQGYRRTEPVIAHVFAHGEPIGRFRVVEPGETILTALVRLGWISGAAGVLSIVGRDISDEPETRFVKSLLSDFESSLSARIKSEDPMFVDQIHELSDPDQGPVTDREKRQAERVYEEMNTYHRVCSKLLDGIEAAIEGKDFKKGATLYAQLKEYRLEKARQTA